jgi:Aspartyl protease
MAQLVFPITADGLCVDVRLNLDGAALHALHSAGQPLPNSIPATGLIDTGTDISAVAPSILQQLGVPVYGHASTLGVAGSIPVRLFQVTFFILDAGQHHLAWLAQPDLLVMELPSGLPVDVLIGMDVLRTCKTLIDGPAGQFALDF